MRVIILGPWTNQRAFVVIVILISQIPINPVMKLNGQTRLRRLEAHRIGSNQGPGRTSGIRNPIPLSRIFIYSIRRVKSCPPSDLNHRISEEEMVAAEIQTIAERMSHAVEEVVQDGIAVNPVMVVAGAQIEL